jgi:ribosome-associated heat shock protein Hsp15
MTGDSQRLDRWLWFARFFKSRSLATRLCASRRVRINGDTVNKAHQALRVGDVLTFPKDAHIRVIEVVALGQRRGPAPEARTLYKDLEPPPERRPGGPPATPPGQRERGAGRPTKAERRALDRLREES